MIIGAQLYTVREYTQTAEGLNSALAKVAAAGYRCAQLSGAGPIEPAAVRAIFDRHGIEIIVTHTNPDRILNETADVINDHRIYGARYIGIGSMPEKYRGSLEGVKKFVEDFRPAAREIRDAGMCLTYHNHSFEFEKSALTKGRHYMDYILEGFADDELQILPDVYWLQYAGCDPAQWLNKAAGRYDLLHYKDMLPSSAQPQACQLMTEVMDGNLNWDAIFAASEAAGAKYAFVEQDDCNGNDPFECLARSFENLSKVFGRAK
ncbi:MAG: sugar phosphate isomerase/epimerase [Clostridiales bacterium]|jgi:sugar phosphate isomerase/epimerase|nr:sugar phosphate isomerase/epimerase [Clostridiales bacterium]